MTDLFVDKIYKHTRDFQWVKEENYIVYNLGCGSQEYNGVVGVDSLPTKAAHIVFDLNTTPWPIESNSVDVVTGFQVFEHLDDLLVVMKEVHRILKPGGRLVIDVPYFRHVGAFQDPTHRHFFTSSTMSYFCRTKKRPPVYTDFVFTQKDFFYGWPFSKNRLGRTYKKFIKNHARLYDSYLSYLFPVPIIVYELEKTQ